ncbi:3-phosphoshikimate 1-carboxyvinyltransferase [Campylobacter sp. faydin G-105]|uniref:3-phosphoshikimate 1-carboxyvinyltransferase n=1 Tax=Campylobacter anatolicus TaxID=2829105 RepID=UPI001B910610|nr:3-phosphoshikimate 1-carboxyvinyltransferase [Campylobacter anatolicus]MBR8462504.1 3-phosphoshikimate 1-carboxyvinyltransferase [Campylobacter anatolicus]
MKVCILNEPINALLDRIASDKSISHRTAIFSLLSDRPSRVRNYLRAEDTLNTLKIVELLGANVKQDGDEIVITPPVNIAEPHKVLECGNSGTAMRLFMGLLAAQDGFYVLSGDEYLNARPMARVSNPLIAVGAKIDGTNNGDTAPLCIRGTKLEWFKFHSPIASAQIKSALLLAALYSNGCEFSEDELSRDHTERMLKGMGADIVTNGLNICLKPMKSPLKPLDIDVPNDPSSAFFFAVAACIVPGSYVVLKNMLLNKTRIEAYKVLERMGADIKFKETTSEYESVGEIEIRYAPLHAVSVSENISWLIDEAPALAVAFACASGTSRLRNARELRVKECDRIAVSVAGLKKCGIDAHELEDGFEITGGTANSAIIDSHGDHRIAMSFAVLGLRCGMIIQKSEFIATSFPNFSQIMRKIGASIED